MAKEEVGIKELVLALRRKFLQCQRVPKLLPRQMKMTYEQGYILTILDNFSEKVYPSFAQGPTADEVVKDLVHWRAHFSLRTNLFW